MTDWIIASIFPSTLCDWSIMNASRRLGLRERNLPHDPEELERVDRADDQVVVGVLAVVEVEAAEQALGQQDGHDLLDVRSLWMVPGVHEHLRLRAEAPADQGSRLPVGRSVL